MPAVPAEAARSDVLHRELADLAERLKPVADMGHARRLAFAIVDALLDWFGEHKLGPVYDDGIAEVALLCTLAKGAAASTHDFGLWCQDADRLAARFFSRVGPAGLWPFEHRIPFELATALRRACEAEAWRFLPLVVRDARALVVSNGGSVRLVDDLVGAALREAEGGR